MPSRYKPIKLAEPEPPTMMERIMSAVGMGGDKPVKKQSTDDQVPSPEPQQTGQGYVPDWMQHGAATAARVAGPWVGSVLGGTAGAVGGGGLGLAGGPAAVPAAVGGGTMGAMAGGAAGGAAGELLAGLIEPGGLNRTPNLKRIGVSAGLGAVPGTAIVRSGRPALSAALGAAQGYAGGAGYKMAEGVPASEALDPREWSAGELALGPGLGAAIGGGLSKLTAPPKVKPTTIEDLVTQATTGTPSAGISDVGTGGLRVGGDVPRVKKAGGTIIRHQEPEIPKVHEANWKDLKKAVSKESEVVDLDKVIQKGNNTAKGNRALNEKFGKAEDQLLKKEQAADLTYTRTELGGTDLPKIQQGVAKAEEQADALKMKEATQEAKNLNTRDKYLATKADEDAAQAKIDALLNQEGVEAGPASVTESSTLKVPGGKQTLKQTFREKLPDEEEGGAPSSPPSGPSVRPLSTPSLEPDIVAMTMFPTKDKAMEVALSTGAADVQRVGRGQYRVVYNKGQAQAPTPKLPSLGPAGPAAQKFNSQVDDILTKVGEPTAPPERLATSPEAVIPPPPVEAPAPVKPEGPTPEQMAVAGRRMSKAEATALAKHLGGEIHQDSPRQWSVRFPNMKTQPKVDVPEDVSGFPGVSDDPLDFPAVPEPERSSFKPSQPYVPDTSGPPPVAKGGMFDPGGLSPEEFKRFNDIRPVLNGAKHTPEEAAEYSALLAKKMGQVEPIPAKPVEPEMSVSDFAGALSKEGEKPIAEIPFSLDRPVAKGPTSKQASLMDAPDPAFEAMLDSRAGEAGGVPKPMNPQGQGTMPSEPTQGGGAIPARMFKSRLEAAGENYGAIKAAKKAGEKVPEEGRSIAGKNAAMENARATSKLPKPAEVPAPKVKDQLEASLEQARKADPDSSDLAAMSPEDQATALADIVKRFKGEKGDISVEMMTRLGLGAAGALAGAATTPDDPLTGALIGGSAGAFAPTMARALLNRVNSNPNMSPGTVQAVGEKIKDYAETFFRMVPDYQRFALLSHPVNLPMNMWVGPWGASIMAGIEHTLAGDAKGMEALKLLMNPKNFPKEWALSLEEAKSRIANASERTEGKLGQAGPEWFRRMTSLPGEGMTAGDVAARNILTRAGFKAEEARRITLTSEPYSPLGRGLTALKKGAQTEGGKKSWLMEMMVPFYKTATNQLEQSAERTPLLGLFYQKYAKDVADPKSIQMAQQLVGTGVSGASYALGSIVPEENSKPIMKFMSNFGGQYGALATAGFMMGQAAQKGGTIRSALQRAVIEGVPLPSADILVKALKFGQDGDFTPPFKVVPPMLDPDVPGSLPGLFRMGGGEPSTGGRPTRPVGQARPARPAGTSRYRPIKPRN